MFNYSLLPCEIERETVASDTFTNCLEPDYLPCDTDFYSTAQLLIGKKKETTGVLPYICCKKYASFDRETHPTSASAYQIRQQPYFSIEQATFPYAIIIFDNMAQLQKYKRVLEKTLFSAREAWEPEYFDMTMFFASLQ